MSKKNSSNSKVKIRDGNFREISPAKENPHCPYTNPSKAQAKGMEHKFGKLGQ